MVTLERVVDRLSSRFYQFAVATPTDSWTFIPAHTHWRPFLVYDVIDVEFCFLEGADKGLTCGLF